LSVQEARPVQRIPLRGLESRIAIQCVFDNSMHHVVDITMPRIIQS